MGALRRHFIHHVRFYTAALIGAALYAFLTWMPPALRAAAAGDGFFAVYLTAMALLLPGLSACDLRERAEMEDEGIFIVLLMVLGVIAVSGTAIVTVLDERQKHGLVALSLALVGVPLGWFTLHTLAATHYANLYYAPHGRGMPAVSQKAKYGLSFPETEEPGIWEFLYFAFVVGMTAQTSDVAVVATKMRRAVLGHSVVSFFYNTAIIAMVINAIVAFNS